MEGWIKTYRKLTEWEWYKDSHMVHLFVHLLLSANHKDQKWKGYDIKRGQLVTGRIELSAQTGISQRSIRTCLERLKSTNELTIKTTNKFSIITICKYEEYQYINDTNDQQNDQQPVTQTTNKRPTNDHKQEIKNDKEKDVITSLTWRDDFQIYLADCKKAFSEVYNDKELLSRQQVFHPNVNIQKTIWKAYENFWGTEAGWKHKKKNSKKDIDWRRTIINAIDINKVYYTKQELLER